MDLIQALREAATSAIVNQGGTWKIDTQLFSRRFKETWLYPNSIIHEPDIEKLYGPIFFLLHKNLSVTNASMVELVSLIRLHCRLKNGDEPADIQFFSDVQFTHFFDYLWQSLIKQSYPDKMTLSDAVDIELENFNKRYSAVFNKTIVLDFFYTSALLHVPPTLQIDLRRIVQESGYIHSAGQAIYVRNVEKAEEGRLTESIKGFLARSSTAPRFATPYADEFFRPFEGKHPVSIRNGLDGVRIQLRKHYIGGRPLIDYFAKLAVEIPDRLHIPQGLADYEIERRASIANGSAKDETIWFITDRDAGSRDSRSVIDYSETTYLFVYMQYIHNDNQLMALKERKPAWYASVTLPHTLSAATINAARAQFKREKITAPIVLDPFCGTGTTLIDAALRIDDVTAIGLDREDLVKDVISDNLDFLSMEGQRLRQFIASDLDTTLSKTTTFEEHALHQEHRPDDWLGRLINALDLIMCELKSTREDSKKETSSSGEAAAVRRVLERGLSQEFKDRFRNLGRKPEERLIIYIVWRAIALGAFSLRGPFPDVLKVVAAELERVIAEWTYLSKVISRSKKGTYGAFLETEGLYSRSSCIDPTFFGKLRKGLNLLETNFSAEDLKRGINVGTVNDSVEFMMKSDVKADLIITDPPYGFNTSEGGSEALKNLFSELPTACLKSIKPGGQLILVLPDFARNGRQIPFYETVDFLIRSILSAAADDEKRFVNPVVTVPGNKANFDWPLYWNSGTVLERRLLKFNVDRN